MPQSVEKIIMISKITQKCMEFKRSTHVSTFLICVRKVTKEHTLPSASDGFRPLEGHKCPSLISLDAGRKID